ncbi:MAG: hypothetical protein RMJ05_02385 [Thermomicrobium sp.]|nr:hypothetical protein [Thermomicrobium sp.]MDW8005546.1 hypothetical protein [Thermomicrobium sp.]
MTGGDDFDRATILALTLALGVLLVTCLGLGLVGWLALRPGST